MNRCPEPSCAFFNRTLPNNAKVCPMCGTVLGAVVEPPPPAPTPTPTPTPIPAPPVSSPVRENTLRSKLKFSLVGGREFYVSGETATIGRGGGSAAPDVDLTGIPNESVVSRAHARVYWDQAQTAYMLVDTSRNGCYLNGKLLTPGTSYRLNQGDEVQLGQNHLVYLKVEFV